MKIGGVSLHESKFTSVQNGQRTDIFNPFLYTAKEQYPPQKNMFKDNKIDLLGGFLAIGVAIFAFKKFFSVRRSIPKNVVDLSDKGLDKLDFGKRTSNVLKEQIFYPMKAILMGDKKQFNKNIKTGLIISGTDEQKVKSYVEAFLNHAKALGIHIETIKNPNKKQQIKEAYKALLKGIEHYKETGQCTIVNIRDLGKISNLKISKLESSSNLEKLLARTPKGVLWTAWTTQGDRLPYFYNNIPTLSVKLVD